MKKVLSDHNTDLNLEDSSTEDLALHGEFTVFKQMFQDAEAEGKKTKHTLCRVLKYLFSQRTAQNIPKNMRQIVLKLVTVSTSEAICESYESKMERYHRRFTKSDLDDK